MLSAPRFADDAPEEVWAARPLPLMPREEILSSLNNGTAVALQANRAAHHQQVGSIGSGSETAQRILAASPDSGTFRKHGRVRSAFSRLHVRRACHIGLGDPPIQSTRSWTSRSAISCGR